MSWKFHVGNVDYRRFLVFRKPSEIGFYSVDGERNFHKDDHQMKWIYKPPSGWDASMSPGLDWNLSADYCEGVYRDFIDNKKMEHILKWMVYNKEKVQCAFLSPKSNDAEVDGKDPDIPEDNLNLNKKFKSTDCYIELKTAKSGSDRERFHSQRLFKWWLQSFLAGIPKIICGFRDKNGMVEELKTYPVESIPKLARSNQEELWNKELCCLKFCHEILQFVKQSIEEDDSETVYKFLYEQDSSYVKCEKLIDPGKYIILPEWFTGSQ